MAQHICTLHSSQAYERYSSELKEALTQTYNKLKECLPGLPHMRFAEQSGNVLVIFLIANKRNSANIPKTAETSRTKPNYPEHQSKLTGHSAICETGATKSTKGKESLPLKTETVYDTINTIPDMPDMLKLPHTIKDSGSGVVYDLIQLIGSVRNIRKRFTYNPYNPD